MLCVEGLILLSVFLLSYAVSQNFLQSDKREPCPCGRNVSTLETRVVGGHNAGKGNFPYASALLDANRNEGRRSGVRPYCGATLITDIHVLTAAHCVRGRSAEDVAVDVGDYDLRHSDDGQLRRARKFSKFPAYRPGKFHDDIAIVEFENPIRWRPDARAALLPPQDFDLIPGTIVSVYGWGRLNYSGATPEMLQSVELPVVDQADCQKKYKSTITTSMICAGADPGRDACLGDSGSGLEVRLDKDSVLCGIVSFGRDCALPHVPGVYTRVSNYVDWIYDQTRSANCKPCIYEEV